MSKSKIVQIIPAEGWIIRWVESRNEKVGYVWATVPIAAWALKEDGSIVPMLTGDDMEGQLGLKEAKLKHFQNEFTDEDGYKSISPVLVEKQDK